jgi:hypothetical protein
LEVGILGIEGEDPVVIHASHDLGIMRLGLEQFRGEHVLDFPLPGGQALLVMIA